jgi:hypothetical protein
VGVFRLQKWLAEYHILTRDAEDLDFENGRLSILVARFMHENFRAPFATLRGAQGSQGYSVPVKGPLWATCQVSLRGNIACTTPLRCGYYNMMETRRLGAQFVMSWVDKGL